MEEAHTMAPEKELACPWGLARVCHQLGLTFGTFNEYLYTASAGEGVDVYVIDTGTNVDHVDFEGRARWGKTIPTGDEDADGNGHGTHCSGTIAGKKYGVAKKANVHAVKVLRSNGSGSMSDVVKGVEFAVESHIANVAAAKAGKKKGFKGSVANMSLGGGKSPTLDMAVNAAVEAGMHFAVAAGNDNADACSYSPAAAEGPVTVGASAFTDERAYFSNYGKCVDIFAPGLNIQSTWIGSEHATNIISGTSMASPHIAGLLAYLLSLHPAIDSAYAIEAITPKQLKKDLIAIGTRGLLTDIPANTPNVSTLIRSLFYYRTCYWYRSSCFYRLRSYYRRCYIYRPCYLFLGPLLTISDSCLERRRVGQLHAHHRQGPLQRQGRGGRAGL
jgi:cerevisin